MSIQTTTPPTADQTGPEAEHPAPQASRFDERGIALQTVIIMVVLLAVAATIAGVIISRGSEASNQLASAEIGVSPANYSNKTLCQGAGHGWKGGNGPCESLATINATSSNVSATECPKHNPRWEVDTSTTPDSCKPRT
ncbi:MAG: hypothetical protein OXL98_06750 [Acidimicrobiaceae bacterium]|nr:hypothetical protein [Acidimicrobiaceae bacterium]